MTMRTSQPKSGHADGPVHRGRRRRGVLMAAVLALTAAASFARTGGVHAQGAIRATHGDWQVRCDTPPGARAEQCALWQHVTAEDRPNVGLVVVVLKTADRRNRLMRVLAPLGVLLPSGLGLTIDGNNVGRVQFERCLPSGCEALVVMDDKLLEQMSSGQSATFIIFQTPEEGIGVPVSLNGFKPGFDALP